MVNKKTRRFFIMVVIVLLALSISLAQPGFSVDDEAVSAAEALYALGLMKGAGTNEDGTPNFDLDRQPTRNEAVTMLVRLLGKEGDAREETWDIPFADVADWAVPYVGYAYANGLTSGISDTEFGGALTVTAAQYLTFVLRSLGYESGKDFQWDSSWELSDKLGITSGQYDKDSVFLRKDVTEVSYSALLANIKDSMQSLGQRLVSEDVFSATLLDEVLFGEGGDPLAYDDITINPNSNLWADHFDQNFYRRLYLNYHNSYNTEATSLQIYTAEQLAAFSVFTNAGYGRNFDKRYISLQSDIDLSKYQWIPISEPNVRTDNGTRFYDSGGFRGSFDGNGYTISGMTYNSSTGSLFGLFGAVAERGIVKNINVGGSIKGTWNLGAVAAYNYRGTIINCSSSVEFESTGYCVGGITGQNNGTISGCRFTGTIKGSSSSGNIGGISGWTGHGDIEECSNSGKITGGFRVGGIAGRLATNGRIISCSNTGTITALQGGKGNIVGVNDGDNTEVIDSM